MLTIDRANSIHGSVDVPPSPDLLFLASVTALTVGAPVRIGPVAPTGLNARRRMVLEDLCNVEVDAEMWRIVPLHKQAEDAPPWRLDNDRIPWRDFCIGVVLGLGRKIRLRSVTSARVDTWKSKGTAFGCIIEAKPQDEGVVLGIVELPAGPLVRNDVNVSVNDVYFLLGLAVGLGTDVSFSIDYVWSSPLRHLLPALGYDLSVQSNATAAVAAGGALERRLRFLERHQHNHREGVTFRVRADFSRRQQQELTVDLPGDEVLVSLLVAAKSIVQKGALVINNASLESWALQNLDFVRKMGCRPAIQQTRVTAFGSAGMLQLQPFGLTPRTVSCIPPCHFVEHLGAMLVTAAFAPGRSVFRDLSDLRNDNPDGLCAIGSCFNRAGIRHGEMADGLIIDGGRDLDGFDMAETLPASLAGACAVAGLGCMGSTAVEDSFIVERWPDFGPMLAALCKRRD